MPHMQFFKDLSLSAFTAGFVASVINCCSPNKLKRPVTVEALLGKEQKEKDPKTAQTEMQQLLATVG